MSSVDVLVVLCLYVLLSIVKMPSRAHKRRQKRKDYYEESKQTSVKGADDLYQCKSSSCRQWLNDGGQAEMSIDSTHSHTPTQYSGQTENREQLLNDEKHKKLNRARVRRSRVMLAMLNTNASGYLE